MEVAYVQCFPVNHFIEHPQLEGGKLPWKQFENARRIELNVLPDKFHGLCNNQIVVECQIFHLFQCHPFGLVLIQVLVECLVYFYQGKVGDGHDSFHFGLFCSFQPVNIFGILGTVF